MKEATVLFMYRVIGRIEVSYQLFRCTLERGDELIEQHFVQPPGAQPGSQNGSKVDALANLTFQLSAVLTNPSWSFRSS